MGSEPNLTLCHHNAIGTNDSEDAGVVCQGEWEGLVHVCICVCVCVLTCTCTVHICTLLLVWGPLLGRNLITKLFDHMISTLIT